MTEIHLNINNSNTIKDDSIHNTAKKLIEKYEDNI